jgi:hypothetical protein
MIVDRRTNPMARSPTSPPFAKPATRGRPEPAEARARHNQRHFRAPTRTRTVPAGTPVLSDAVYRAKGGTQRTRETMVRVA